MKWALPALLPLLVVVALLTRAHGAGAQQATFVSTDEGWAGSRFQIVGEAGWTPGETITIDFTFIDVPPDAGAVYAGAYHRSEKLTVLRDGSWSFPVVINSDLFPFPLWRPGFIGIRVTGAEQTTFTLVTYLVDGRRPAGAPPLADLGFGPDAPAAPAAVAGTAAFALATGVLLTFAGATRRRDGLAS